MARAENTQVVETLERFYREYYADEIGELAQGYPTERKSLYVDWDDLYQFDPDLADDVRAQPAQLLEYAEEALRRYDLPVDVKLGQAHVRIRDLPEKTDIRDIRHSHHGNLLAVSGIVRKATDVRPKITTAAFECQRCGTLTRIPMPDGNFQEPHECQGCERQGPFRVNFDQSEFVDAQKLRIQESPEGLRGGETPQSIDVHIEDDVTGRVTAGDHVTVVGILKLDQQGSDNDQSAMFDIFMEGSSIEIDDEEFEEMDISDAEKQRIVELSNADDLYDQMVGAIAPSIYGYEDQKLAMTLQLFSGVTKHLPDGSRIRGDMHMLLIGDPGTGKCVKGDTEIVLGNGRRRPIREVVENNLDDTTPVDDGVYGTVDFEVPSLDERGRMVRKRARKVWKREAPPELYRIVTRSGREIDVTPSHPLFVASGGRIEATRADQLSRGEFVAKPKIVRSSAASSLDVSNRRSRSPNAVRFEPPDRWTPSLARLIGYVVAEGYATLREDNTGEVTVTNEDEEILSDVCEAYEKLDLPYNVRDGRKGKTATEVSCTASEFVSFLENLEPALLERSADQRVPSQLFEASNDIVAAFLRAYVDSEGHVSTKERELTVASMSRELLKDVRSLLLAFGIHATIEPRYNDSFRLRISGPDFQRYCADIGFVTLRKAETASAFGPLEENPNTDIVPVDGDLLSEVRHALGLSQFELEIPRATYQHYERGDRNPSRASLERVIERFEDRLDWLRDQRDQVVESGWDEIETLRGELGISQADLAEETDVTQTAISYYERNEVVPDGGVTADATDVVLERIDEGLAVESTVEDLRNLLEAEVRWDRIEKIEAVEHEDDWVYDLEVAGTHNYVAEGLLSHNSQLLQYIRQIAPRSVYTSGKGSSSAGLCVTGDTVIHTENGFRQIRDIVTEELPESVDEETHVEKAVGVPTFDQEEGDITRTDSSLVWRMPQKPCRRIETSHGKELEASLNTPILTCGRNGIEWRQISEIEAGEYVAIPRYDEIDRTELPVRDFLELSSEKIKLAADSVTSLRESLREEFGTLRNAASALDLSEDFIYLHLKNRHVPLGKLDRILDAVGASRTDVAFDRLMLRHGSSITVPASFDEDLMYLLGLVFGDGDISLDRRGENRGLVRISNSDEELLERAVDIVEEKFDKRPDIEYQAGRVPCIRITSATIARLFSNAGMRSPKEDLELAPELTVAEHADAFLRGLMDADGSVSVREGGGSSVLMSTISEDLARQIQLMLETYGVRARTRERDRRGSYELESGHTIESKHVQYFVEIQGADVDRFADAIGFECSDKQESLEELVGSNRRQREKIPVGAALAAVDGQTGEYYHNVHRGDNPGRMRARAMLEDLELGHVEAEVREVVDASLRWDEVVAVVDTGHKEVFDLTVPGTNNFVGNGIVTHNTAAAVRDDFAEGQQWSLEAGALVLADRGIAAVDELDKMRSEDRSAMHEALEQQSYHPNSEVLLADGRRVNIGEFVDRKMAARGDEVVEGVDCEILPVEDVGVHSVDLDAKDVEKLPVDRVSRHEAPEEFVRVSFSNGRDVLVTPEHPMFVEAGGEVGTVAARDVEEGAFVPAPRQLPNSATPVDLDAEPQQGKEKDVTLPETLGPDLAELLGLLVAEGHSYAGSSHEIGFSNQDQRLLERAARLMRSVTGMESTDTTNEFGTVTKRWISTKLYRWFESNFPEVMQTARQKRIPARVLGASQEEIRRFLVGAFAGDGGVESEAMSYSTASDGLARDYADALGKIGVASRIHHDTAEDSWKVYVMGDSTERFVDAVVDEADERYDDAMAFVERSRETPRHHDVLPSSAAREIRDLRTLLGLRKTGQFRANLDENFGVRVETVRGELAALRDRADAIRSSLPDRDSLSDVRELIGWSGRELGARIDETASAVHYAEGGGYDESRRAALASSAREAVSSALAEFETRGRALEDRADLRYYRITDVERVPNEGEYACDWVYDVTVEPTNTFVSEGVVLHNSISISKAGINATLKSRCSLLGAANPKYGRFDQYEPIGEQIDLEPALISRFDLIFTVTDTPDEEADAELAEHILKTNYAGELHTHREQSTTSNHGAEEVESVTDTVAPTIDPELLRKYIAYAKRHCFPTMTDDAQAVIRDFYVDLRARGTGEDAPVPVTARKLEALVRLAEASARVRLSDTVEVEDAERATQIARRTLEDIGMDPETGELDADVVETGTSKSQRDRIKNLKGLVADIEDEYDEGAPVDVVLERAEEVGIDAVKAEHEIEQLKQKGEVYEPRTDYLRTT